MRRIQKILAGVFLTGIFIGGVGTGLAVAEYSSLTYGGEKIIGEDSLVTRNLDFDFELDGRMLEVSGQHYLGKGGIKEVEIDDTVPVGTVRYEITYNERTITPWLQFEAYEEEWDGEGEETEVHSSEDAEDEDRQNSGKLGIVRLAASYHGDDFAVLMENKDVILEELKQGKISSYHMAAEHGSKRREKDR